MTKYLYQDLTYEIIGAAMEVHSVLGSGFLEAVYQSALAHEFGLRNIPFKEQVRMEVCYKGVVVGEYKADFLVNEEVIIEIKASKKLVEIDEAQLINYLKGTGIRLGLLINFGTSSLEYKRRIV
jgi:GxxExxY protein